MAELDMILGGIGLLFLIVGALAALFGLMNFGSKRGKARLVGGAAGAIIGLLLVSMFGIPVFQVTTPPTEQLFNQVEIINANGGTIGSDKLSISGLITVNYTADSFVSGEYWYFNVTVTLGGTDSQKGTVYEVKPGSVPILSNNVDSTVSGEVLAKQSDGDRDVVITVGSTSYDEKATVTQKQLTSQTISFQVHWGSILTKLESAQYSTSFTLTYLITGDEIGTTTISLHVTIQGQA
jgi:hypothetical protein